MSAFGPGQLRMTTTRGRTFDWETSKAPPIVTGQGGESCAWHPANKHLKIIEKIRPPSPLRPKAAVPSLQELQREDETKMRPTNAALYVDLVKSVAKENSSSSLGRTGKSILEGSASNLGGTARSGLRQTMTAQDAATMRKREIMELARKEDQEHRMETLKKNVAKAKAKKEKDFEDVYSLLQEERRNFIEKTSDQKEKMGIDQYLKMKSDVALQKRKGLHTEWKECVFKNIQDQLIDRVDTMDEKEIQARRRDLFQKYIDASTAKPGGLFLDIVIENEYDPFTWKKNLLKYRAKPALVSNGPGFTDRFGNPVFDPVKRDLEKLKSEAQQAKAVGGGTGGLELAEGQSMGRDTLGHEHWSKIEATPFFDRAAKVLDALAAGKGPKVRKGTKTNIDLTDYEFPMGPEKTTQELHGLYGRGKKTFTDWEPGKSLYQATA